MTLAALTLALAVLLTPIAGAGRMGAGPRRQSTVISAVTPTEPDLLRAASALEVFSVCLSAGMAVPDAARGTAAHAPDQLSQLLLRVADLLALGVDPAAAWTAPPGMVFDDRWVSLLRLARRSASSGAALAASVAELAEQLRRDADHRATAASERAAVVIAGPLGLCFLPAFVCVGVVPVVAGLAGDVFGAGLW